MRGDGPGRVMPVWALLSCSPRVRGWSGGSGTAHAPLFVFPAHAGMALFQEYLLYRVYPCSPRMRGWLALTHW